MHCSCTFCHFILDCCNSIHSCSSVLSNNWHSYMLCIWDHLFYSMLGVVMREDLIISDSIRFFVTILSSLVNLSPMSLLGELCLAKGLTGIDQQFVHNIHPLTIIILLLVVVIVKHSIKITFTFGRHGVRYFCLLLILTPIYLQTWNTSVDSIFYTVWLPSCVQ